MVCQMELVSHILAAATFGMMKGSGNKLTVHLIEHAGDNSLIIMYDLYVIQAASSK